LLSSLKEQEVVPDDGTWQRMAHRLDEITAMLAVSALEIGKPYKDSCLARQDDNRQRRLACDWQERPVDELHAEIQHQLEQANDHLRMFTRALTEPRIIYSPFTLARGVLLASAQSFHLCDPQISVDDRISRLLNFHYTSNLLAMNDDRRRRSWHTGLGQAGGARSGDRRTGAVRTATRIDHQASEERHVQGPGVLREPCPKDIELLTELLGPEYGASAFRLCSAGVHAQPHLSWSTLRTQMVGAGREGMITAQRGLTAQSLTGIATATAAGYVIACERAMAYFGVESSTSRRDSARAALAELSGSDRSDHSRPID
jgi:hypothetical protein